MNKKFFKRTSLYIPKELIEEIDLRRQDVPRSKFVLKILEKYWKNIGDLVMKVEKNNFNTDLEISKCPISCDNCNRIYSNGILQTRIICRCICHEEARSSSSISETANNDS
jgi:hypothetical protein